MFFALAGSESEQFCRARCKFPFIFHLQYTNGKKFKPKMTLLATATEDELLKAGNVAYTRLLDAKKQHNKIK
jgi:hypothetical protein